MLKFGRRRKASIHWHFAGHGVDPVVVRIIEMRQSGRPVFLMKEISRQKFCQSLVESLDSALHFHTKKEFETLIKLSPQENLNTWKQKEMMKSMFLLEFFFLNYCHPFYLENKSNTINQTLIPSYKRNLT